MCRINCWISVKLIFIIIFCCLTSISYAAVPTTNPIDNPKWTTKYDVHFNKYSKRYFGVGFDWKWFKAQSITESALKENAESWVGAKGLMQVMPATYKDIQKRNTDITGNIFDPRWNIEAGIYYDSTIYKQWKGDRSIIDRMCLMFGSYNAGIGYLLKAQKLCVSRKEQNCNTWSSIVKVSHEVPVWKQEETIGYVKRILKLMGYNI